MIGFACQQCGKRFARPESTAGSVVFCSCGTRNVVPWESTIPPAEMPAEAAHVPPEPGLPAPSYPQTPWSPQESPRRVIRQRNPSYCFNHQDTPPEHTCAECGEKFCSDCVVELEGRALCGPCKNLQMRKKQRSPHISVMAILAPIVSLVAGPAGMFVIFVAALVAAEGRRRSGGGGALGVIAIITFLALGIQLLALTMSLLSLRSTETNRVSGRSLAITGM